MSATMTLAPSAASRSATTEPMPPAAPVTIATWPVRAPRSAAVVVA
jgi:hypothetical protein